jgi:hypothetical protein
MGLNMGVFSYNQRLHFGFIADADAAPDVAKFNGFLDEAFLELRDAAHVKAAEHINVVTSVQPARGKPRTAPAKSPQRSSKRNGESRESGGKPVQQAS